MQGVYFGLQHVPFEAALGLPGVYPGLETYIKEMQKYQPSFTYDEVAFDGWISAAQFVTGLKAVGRDLTQKKLVAAINAETAFTGDGLTTARELDDGTLHDDPAHTAELSIGRPRGERAVRAQPSSKGPTRCSCVSTRKAPPPYRRSRGHLEPERQILGAS